MRYAILLGMALAVSACESPEDQLENSIRGTLSNTGATVESVELTKGEDGNMSGFAMVRGANGRSGRMNCSAHPTEGTNYSWTCLPTIDEATLQDMEGQIRTELAKQAEVVEVDMQKHNDDDHMRGFARIRAEGTEARLNCSATRDTANTAMFNWECQQGEAAAANAAPSPDAPADVAEGEGGK